MSENHKAIIELRGITKKFGDFIANENVDLVVKQGEVLALLGENGAGKTTLMNQLYGLYRPTAGEIWIRGKKTEISDPNVAIANGIGMVHQHFMLIEPFTVTENIVLGNEPVQMHGILNMKNAAEEVRALSEKYGLSVDPNAHIRDISVGMQQRVEILKVLYRGADILIFDEPTAVLTPQEIQEFSEILHKFTQNGKTVIIITHKLKEIMEMADVCTIIRRGVVIDTVKVQETNENDLAKKMVGRNVKFKVEKPPIKSGDVVLNIKDLHVRDRCNIKVINGLNLEVKAGEIVGIAGVDGNGQTELVEALMGICPVESGTITLNGEDLTNQNISGQETANVGSIPADRVKHGFAPDFTVAENLIMKSYNRHPFSKRGILDADRISQNAEVLINRFDIRTPSQKMHVKNLSGGNQQKVIIAREISSDLSMLIASQPTRGLDVGAIEFIHAQIVEQRNKNKAVLLISFELDEIMSLSDRIAVIYEGQITAVLDVNKTDQNEIGLFMAGGGKHE